VAPNNLAIRLLTTLVASPLILGVMFFAEPIAWFLLVTLVSLAAAYEVLSMTHPGDRLSQCVGTALSGLLSTASYFSDADPRLFTSALLFSISVGLLLPLVNVLDISKAALRITALIATPLYVGVMFGTLTLIRKAAADDGPGFVLMTLMFAWLGDTGGYAGGRLFGKHKLYEAVSPKKTWEGLAGALVGSVAGGLCAHFGYLPSIPLGHALLLGLLSGVLGQLGDLAESLLKRAVNAKDSGRMVPGHGGVLDRVDALLLVSPAVYLYLLWR